MNIFNIFKPNYKKLSISELEDALKTIDRKKYPKRVSQIESLLNDPEKREIIIQRSADQQEKERLRKEEIRRRSEPFAWAIFFTISAFVVYFFGFISARVQTGNSVIESTESRFFIALVF